MSDDKQIAPASSQYTVIRSQIEEQHNTSNQRIFWLILSQSFFINAFVMLITQPPKGKEAPYGIMLNIIPLSSILTIVFTYLDVIGSIIYVDKLVKHYQRIDVDDTKSGQLPPISGDKADRIFARISPVLLPVMFIIIWIVMWAYTV